MDMEILVENIELDGRTLVLGSKYNINIKETNENISIIINEIYMDEIFYKNISTEEYSSFLISEVSLNKIIESIDNIKIGKIYTVNNNILTGVVGRKEVELFVDNEEIDIANTVLISISDPDNEPIPLEIQNSFKKALDISFWDVEEGVGHYQPLSEENAKDLKNFILENKSNKFLVNCEAGMSRSAGVALAIECLIQHNGDKYSHQTSHSDLKEHPRYSPNFVVYDKILSQD